MGGNTMYVMTYLGEERKRQVKLERKKKKQNQAKYQQKQHDSRVSAFLTVAFIPRRRGHVGTGSWSVQLVQGLTSAAQLAVRLQERSYAALASALPPVPIFTTPSTFGSQHPSRHIRTGSALGPADGYQAACVTALRTRSRASCACGCSMSSSCRTVGIESAGCLCFKRGK